MLCNYEIYKVHKERYYYIKGVLGKFKTPLFKI